MPCSLNHIAKPIIGNSIDRAPFSGRLSWNVIVLTVCLLCAQNSIGVQPSVPTNVRHGKVYAEPGRFGGWPANHGIWSWGDEILVGFSARYFKDNGPGRHSIDHARPDEHLLARSRNGGETWTIENPAKHGAVIPVGKALHGVTPPGLHERPWEDCPGGIDFMGPDFALTVRMIDASVGPSRFSYSLDRGHTWQGPYRLPLFDQHGIAARTDYLVNGKHDCLLFLTAAKRDGQEGRLLCVHTISSKGWFYDTSHARMLTTFGKGAVAYVSSLSTNLESAEMYPEAPVRMLWKTTNPTI
jgi:hypothetical protein